MRFSDVHDEEVDLVSMGFMEIVEAPQLDTERRSSMGAEDQGDWAVLGHF